MAEVFIVGVRGLPNRYGGFERLVECLAPFLVARNHTVTVYCQDYAEHSAGSCKASWRGVLREYVRPRLSGPLGTLEYDLRCCTRVPRNGVCLVFGYGTGIFNAILSRRDIAFAINMDGMEWQRAKWGRIARAWLRLNERIAAKLATILIADHPVISDYLHETYGREAEMIAYGAGTPNIQGEQIRTMAHPLFELQPRTFDVVIARPEPENQIHVFLEAAEKCINPVKMVVVGDYSQNKYGRQLQRRFPDTLFAGPIYEDELLDYLRSQCRYYYHGHSAGGTNPSLLEAMSAGALVVAHDNVFNRWVTGSQCLYFRSVNDLTAIMKSSVLESTRQGMIQECRALCVARFSWRDVLNKYADVIDRLAGRAS
jgi:glycosyltransferase involved in cell wall biosynthesis